MITLQQLQLGGNDKIMRIATNIIWDTDDSEITLPTEIIIPVDMDDEEDISNYLSFVTGFCHKGYNIINIFRISISLSCFIPEFIMEIPVPYNQDPEEYINQFLDNILNNDLRYNVEWDFLSTEGE